MSLPLETILTRWEKGGLSSALAVMEMLLFTRDRRKVEAWLVERRALAAGGRGGELLRMIHENREGCDRVVCMAADDGPLRDVVDVGAMFDRVVDTCEEASVALYSLGNMSILEAATGEIVDKLESWGLLGSDRTVLDFGCGIGRFEVALSPRVRSIAGVDVSRKMVAVARRRAADLANVRVEQSDGVELPFGDEAFNWILSVDSMPYVVGLGAAIIEASVRAFARVLRGGGELTILEFSYRDDVERDRADVVALAERHGFEVLENGSSPFALWNGRAFRLRRSSANGTRRMGRGRRRAE